MDRKEVADFLNSLEQKYPVNEWKVSGVHVWPIIKFNIFVRWRSIQLLKYNSLLKKASKKKKKINTVTSILISFKYLFALLLKKEKKLPVIFVGADTHRVDFEAEFINRYFQPITEYLHDQYRFDSLLVEYSSDIESKSYKSRDQLLFLDLYLPAARFLQFFNVRREKESLLEFDFFLKDIGERMPEIIKSIKYLKVLRAQVREVKANGLVFNILLKKHKPRYIMGLCYYSTAMYAMNYEAHKKGIVSIDMQHGSIGYTHPAYGNYSKVPTDGYNVMPKVFWCWDTSSARTIGSWTSKQKFHYTIIGGNPWSSYFSNRSRASYKFPKKKIILYTMQFNFPENYIIEAIRRTPADYQWWLRLHPRTLAMKENIEEFLIKENVLEKIDVDNATLYPLPEILANAAIHISRSSGSVIEAAQLGVKTIIINETGVDNYKDLIETKEAIPFLEESSEGLLSIIMENADTSFSRKADTLPDYREVIDRLLKE